MELNLEELAKEDYSDTRANLIKAEEAEGKLKIAEDLICEAQKKLDSFDEYWLKYQKDKTDNESLRECARIAREARLLSVDALEKAKSVDLPCGLKVVKWLFGIVIILSFGYFLWHWYKKLPWFGGYFWLEITIFSVFGVLTNLAYSAAKHVLSKDFDKWHMGWYWSKIVQAPFVALAVILFLKNIKIDVLQVSINFPEASTEVMSAVAYIMGVFSRRTWEYLEKIKDWIMPSPKSEESA